MWKCGFVGLVCRLTLPLGQVQPSERLSHVITFYILHPTIRLSTIILVAAPARLKNQTYHALISLQEVARIELA